MGTFSGQLAVVTGAGSGIGRQLAIQLAGDDCSLALLDLNGTTVAETVQLAMAVGAGNRVTSMTGDAASASVAVAFADHVRLEHETDHVDLLFNNAGVGGGESFVFDDPAEWERTFDVCWNSVYRMTRAFFPMLLAAPAGNIVNVSSVNALFAANATKAPVTAYASAKSAVKGFTEALQIDLRTYAPTVRATLVLPGLVATNISENRRRIHGLEIDQLSANDLDRERRRLLPTGVDVRAMSDDELRRSLGEWDAAFGQNGGMQPAEAARIILGGVAAGEWRIVVGAQAVAIDRAARTYPTSIYRASERGILLRMLSRAPLSWSLGRLGAGLPRRLRHN